MNTYGKASLDVRTVKRFVSGVNGNPREKRETDFRDRPNSGRPAAAVNEDKGTQTGAFIRTYRRITIVKACKNFHVSVCSLVCLFSIKWIPRMLIYSKK